MDKNKEKKSCNIPRETREKIDKLKKAIEDIGFTTKETRDGEIRIGKKQEK